MGELIFLRHGRTAYNERRLYCGVSDPPLSPDGRREILGLAKSGLYPAATLYLTSGSRRADETLSLIAPGAAFERNVAFREMDFGAFEGRSYEELKGDPRYIAWITDPSGGFRCPGGESKSLFTRRVSSALHALLPRMGEDFQILLLSHGGVACALMCELFPGEREYFDWQPGFGRGYRILFDEKHLPLSWREI